MLNKERETLQNVMKDCVVITKSEVKVANITK